MNAEASIVISYLESAAFKLGTDVHTSVMGTSLRVNSSIQIYNLMNELIFDCLLSFRLFIIQVRTTVFMVAHFPGCAQAARPD